MYDTKLATLADFQKWKQKSNSSNQDKLDEATIEAQIDDIKPLLGERLFNALMRDVAASGVLYNNLLNEHTYTIGDCEYYHSGLKAVIVFYASARITMFGDVIDNPFGQTRKLNKNTSEPIDYATKKSKSNHDKNLAYNLWLDVRNYLVRTNEPLFNCGTSSSSNTFKIDKIGG